MKLKVCGMKYPENIQAVATLQPDYMGFIFYEKSSRFFDGPMPTIDKSIKKTGVFVNASIAYILDKVQTYDLQAVQLHGEESPEYCVKIKQEIEGIEVIKVFSMKDTFDFSILIPYQPVCDYFLFDTKGKLPGGNGFTFDWNLLKDYPYKKPYFLSGGIGLEEQENVQSFLRRQESNDCYAIDVNSKFEIEPGLKNIEKLKKFLRTKLD